MLSSHRAGTFGAGEGRGGGGGRGASTPARLVLLPQGEHPLIPVMTQKGRGSVFCATVRKLRLGDFK